MNKGYFRLQEGDLDKFIKSIKLASDVLVQRNGKTSRGIVYGVTLSKLTLCLDAGEMLELPVSNQEEHVWERLESTAVFQFGDCYSPYCTINFYGIRKWALEALAQ